jgi:hypothetical protein
MTFHVGQKVVCVVEFDGHYGQEIFPKRGGIYTVRTAEVEDDGQWIRLHEIVNPAAKYAERFDECMFAACGFRPVVERKTDISIFKKMLTDATNPMDVA